MTVVELLVVTTLFSIVAAGFYQVMLSGSRGSDVARSVIDISEEARLGFNRMVRDTREANAVTCDPACPTSTSYSVRVDFNGDGLYQNPPQNLQGDYELLTYSYSGNEIQINGETLVKGVELIPGEDVFSYSSSKLEYDWNGDGVTTWQELNDASCPAHGISGVGDCDSPAVLDDAEARHITNVTFAFRVKKETRTTEFYAEAQLRNKR